MAVWLVRAGSHGEYESKFIAEGRIYVTWDLLDVDLSKLPDQAALRDVIADRYPDEKPKAIMNWASQVWPFVADMKPGDLVILPLKSRRTIQVGEVAGGYHYNPDGPQPYYHWRSVKWIREVPRSHFGKDLLYSFGAFMTICRITRNNAEQRLEAMRAGGWKPESIPAAAAPSSPGGEDMAETDLEELARDQIARLVSARFKGHGLTRLVEAILKAQGYTTYRSPEGSDGGADIVAGSGPLGFGEPRLCVEVKSEDTPIDRPAVDKLMGAVQKFGASEGLFVAWGGFKSTVHKELATSFFRVRLWTQQELLEELFEHYDQLDDDIKAELPLKRVWTIAMQED